jgi:hypothetical protein
VPKVPKDLKVHKVEEEPQVLKEELVLHLKVPQVI